MQVKKSDMPLVRRVDGIDPEARSGIDRRVIFSPNTVGSQYMTLALVQGRAGADMQAKDGAEMLLTLQGSARLIVSDTSYELTGDTAVAIPAELQYSMEILGDEEWIAVTAGCYECPLMLAKLMRENMEAVKPPQQPVVPILRKLGEIVPERLYGFERRVIFSPSTVGSDYLKFAQVHGKPGAKSVPHSHPGGELALTLHGNAQLSVNGEFFQTSSGTAIAVPPAVVHPAEATGTEVWVVITSYCDECPLMREKLNKEPRYSELDV